MEIEIIQRYNELDAAYGPADCKRMKSVNRKWNEYEYE